MTKADVTHLKVILFERTLKGHRVLNDLDCKMANGTTFDNLGTFEW